MNHETAPVRSGSQIESLPFSELPHQTKLFLDYLNDPVSLRQYYPNAVVSSRDIGGFASQVLANYSTDRAALCDALEDLNRQIGAGAATLENISLLRRSGTVAVVTGQQAGLFAGPLYTIYKALSAIKLAEAMNAAGTSAVPVFWVASEDHDLDEVAKTYFIETDGRLLQASYKPSHFVEGSPVGNVVIDDSMTATLNELFASVAGANSSLRDELTKAWSPGISYATAFARSIASLLGRHGLVVIDPLHDGFKKLASPLYAAAVERSGDMVSAIRDRSVELVDSGYHAQVLVEPDYFPLFWHTDHGRRVALRRVADDVYRSKDDGREFPLSELARIAKSEPQRFSPGVMLRPIVQDFLLPTICYFGGAAEIAYFAQNSEAYRVLGRPVTPIFHRQSFTIVEPKQQRVLDKLSMRFQGLFNGIEPARARAVERSLAPELPELFSDVSQGIKRELDRLDQSLSEFDPTLAVNLGTRSRKIQYHIEALKKKAYAAKLKKDGTVDRQVQMLFNALLPNGELQERSVNIHSYIFRYGEAFIDRLYNAVDLDDRGHRIIHI